MKKLFISWTPISNDFGLLVARLVFGLSMAFGHGWGKLTRFGELADTFPSVFGMGSEVSLVLAVFAEFFCALFLAVGFASRFSLMALSITMGVAAFSIHADDPFSTKEKAIIYLAAYVALFFTGPGKISIDKLSAKR